MMLAQPGEEGNERCQDRLTSVELFAIHGANSNHDFNSFGGRRHLVSFYIFLKFFFSNRALFIFFARVLE